jgi:hypothetical protein
LIESGQPTNQILYAYSRALGRSPSSIDKEKSLKALESLAESDGDDFWRKLARTQLADETGKYKPKKKPAKEGGKP